MNLNQIFKHSFKNGKMSYQAKYSFTKEMVNGKIVNPKKVLLTIDFKEESLKIEKPVAILFQPLIIIEKIVEREISDHIAAAA
jgi:hypothetical protein